jgi:hypothetical protein
MDRRGGPDSSTSSVHDDDEEKYGDGAAADPPPPPSTGGNDGGCTSCIVGRFAPPPLEDMDKDPSSFKAGNCRLVPFLRIDEEKEAAAVLVLVVMVDTVVVTNRANNIDIPAGLFIIIVHKHNYLGIEQSQLFCVMKERRFFPFSQKLDLVMDWSGHSHKWYPMQ